MADPIPPLYQAIIPHHSTIIVGLSGGPDSMYLLYQLHNIAQSLSLKLIAAHLDHQWQASSVQAAQLCQTTCDALHIPLVIKKRSELNFQPSWNGSQEEIGRKLRQYFFTTLAQEYQAAAVALAHHQQDQQETFFIRLLRGSGLTGLTGIQIQQGLYIRPLLGCNKTQIMEYLDTHNIRYYNDPTNDQDTYLRNRIRHHVIPALQSADHRFDINLASTMHQLARADDFINQQADIALNQIQTPQGVQVDNFLKLEPILQDKILLNLLITQGVPFQASKNFFHEMTRFLHNNKNKRHAIHPLWFIEKNKGHFYFIKIDKNL